MAISGQVAEALWVTSAALQLSRPVAVTVLLTVQRGERYVATVEGLPGRSYRLELRSAMRISRVDGARLASERNGTVVLEVSFPGSGDRYVRREVSLEPRP